MKKSKEVALHDQTQEWKQLEHALNVEPLHFPEKGIDRYEAANAQRQSLLKDISLREQQLAHIKQDNESLEPAKQSDIDAFNSLYQQENEIKQKEYELRSLEKKFLINNVIKKVCNLILVGMKRIMMLIVQRQ